MVTLLVQNQTETKSLFQFFLKENHLTERDDLIKVGKETDSYFLTIDESIHKKKVHQQLKKYILTRKKEEWCRQILIEDFFYTDVEEQNQIIEMIHAILEGKRKDLPVHINQEEDEHFIDTALSETLHFHHPFSFDAFIKFRLKDYLTRLIHYVEIAIDEYKLEQDYQLFIQTLRDFIIDRKPLIKEINLVDEDGFVFYDTNFKEMKRSELYKTIDRKLLSNHPIYVDSTTIAPLISISPDKINIFTNDLEKGLMRTIMNIFEERIHLFPLIEFEKRKKEHKNSNSIS